MIRLLTVAALLLFAEYTTGQKLNIKSVVEKLNAGQAPVASDFGFTSYRIDTKADSISFYTYQKPNTLPNSVYIVLPGSNAEHIYTYHKEKDGGYWFSSLTSFDFSYLPDNYLLVIVAKPDAREFTYGYSNKRWASFSEPPIQSLVKLKIPIFQVHGANDDMTPLESAYIVPLEFARLQKNNLTFRVYTNCNHSLIENTKDGQEINHMASMMKDFFDWVAKH